MFGKGNIGYHNDILGSDESMKKSDTSEFSRLLRNFYKVEKREDICSNLKKDIRIEEKYRDLVKFLGYSDEEFSISLVASFPDILNKCLLGYLKGYVTGKPVVTKTAKKTPVKTGKRKCRLK